MNFKKREPKFLNGDNRPQQRKQGFIRHEKALARDLGGALTPASGALGMKGDVHGGAIEVGQRVMAEAKSTQARQITLKLDWLEKLLNESFEARMEPVLFLRLDSMSSANYQDWAVVPKDRYVELLELEAAVRRGAFV